MRRPSPATVISVAALFAASGGVGYAAATITSAQIRDNTVQSRDIKNGTIVAKDIRASTRKALKGQAGPRGVQGLPGTPGTPGATGPQGATGPAGPSSTLIFKRAASPTLSADFLNIFSTTLEPGAYHVIAKTTLASTGNDAGCVLRTTPPNVAQDSTSQTFPAGGGQPAVVSFVAAFTLAGTATLTLACEIESGTGVTATNSAMTVTRVGSVVSAP